jgi:DNA sulfur modification protein DndB
MDKGEQLNQRVWRLFEKAGFQTQPNSASPDEFVVTLPPNKKRPVDLHATEPELGITIVGSNKSGGIKGWSANLNDFKKVADTAKADAALLVVTGFDPDDEARSEAKELKIAIWSEEQLEYFEAVAETIRGYAKYEIIHALGLTTKEEQDTHRVLALRIEQPTKGSDAELFMFCTSPERLLKTCVIYRRAVGSAQAYQRMLRRDRLQKIRNFVSSANALLPTNIIVHLSDKVTVDPIKINEFKDGVGQVITLSKTDFQLVSLNIPMAYASLEVLDGQHRLFGFANTDAATKKGFNLVVLGIRGLSPKKRQETFVAINDNSRRMDPNLVAYLKYTTNDAACQKDSELMAIRIVVDLNSTTPFSKSVRVLDIGKQKITLKGFSGYDLKGLLGPRGALRKYYPSNTPAEYVRALRLYFSTIRGMFKDEWDDPQKYIIATNRGISAFLKLLKSLLGTHDGPLTAYTIKKYYEPLESFAWDYKSLHKSYVGSQGWKEFYRDLAETIRKKYPEFKSL